MGEAVLLLRLEDEDITRALSSTMFLPVWSAELPTQPGSVVLLLVREVQPQPRAALLPAHVHEAHG
jgi:hypothetical protein